MFHSYLNYILFVQNLQINAGIETSPSPSHQGGWVTRGLGPLQIDSPTVQESRPLPQHTREGLDVYNQMVVDLDDVDTEMKSSSFLEAEKSSTVTLVEASRFLLQGGCQQHGGGVELFSSEGNSSIRGGGVQGDYCVQRVQCRLSWM